MMKNVQVIFFSQTQHNPSPASVAISSVLTVPLKQRNHFNMEMKIKYFPVLSVPALYEI